MNTRCNPGDLAIIIREEIGCESNIGRVVHVGGPLRRDVFGRPSWPIQPVTLEPWQIVDVDDSIRFMQYLELGIFHPDAWLIPIKAADDAGIGENPEELTLERTE